MDTSEVRKFVLDDLQEYVLASEVARCINKSVNGLFALYPALTRYQATESQKVQLQFQTGHAIPHVTLIKYSELGPLTEKKTATNTAYAAPPEPALHVHKDKGYILAHSNHAQVAQLGNATPTTSSHSKARQLPGALAPRNVMAPYFESDKACRSSADSAVVELVPIRLNIEHEGYRVAETFTWNLNEQVVRPKTFAIQLCHDEELPNQFVGLIASSIEEQLKEYVALMSIDIGPRVVQIRLSIQLGSTMLNDAFFWDHAEQSLTPEHFAELVCADVGISGEFEAKVAHAIREQILSDRKATIEALQGDFYHDGPADKLVLRQLSDCFRVQNADDWSPSLQMQSWMDMEKLEKEAELQARRQKRARESGEDLTASFSGRRSFRARKQVSYAEESADDAKRAPRDPVVIDYRDVQAFPRLETPPHDPPSEKVCKYLASRGDSYAQLAPDERKMLDQLRVKAAGQTLDHKARAVFALQRNMNQSQHVMNRPSGVQAAALPLQVGQVIGGASVGTPSSRTESPAGMEFSQHSSTVDVDNLFSDKVYINNSLNRKLGRVGKLRTRLRGPYKKRTKDD